MDYPVKYLALLSFANVMFLFSRLILDIETSHDLREDGFLPATTRSLAYDFRSIRIRSKLLLGLVMKLLPELIVFSDWPYLIPVQWLLCYQKYFGENTFRL